MKPMKIWNPFNPQSGFFGGLCCVAICFLVFIFSIPIIAHLFVAWDHCLDKLFK